MKEAIVEGGAAGMNQAFLRPRAGLVAPEILLQLWRSKWLILLSFLPPFVAVSAWVMTAPAPYAATLAMLVAPEPGRGYDLLVGADGRGAVVSQTDILRAERDLALSDEVLGVTVSSLGVGRLYPDIAAKMVSAAPDTKASFQRRALEQLARQVRVEGEEGSSVLRFKVLDGDRSLAQEILRAWLKAYLVARSGTVGADADTSVLLEQRRSVEDKLETAESALISALTASGLPDLAEERLRLNDLARSLGRDRAAVEAAIREEEARAGQIARQLASTPQTAEIFKDSPLSPPAVDAVPELRDAESSDLGARVARLEQLVRTGGGALIRRTGPNPLYLDLTKDAQRSRQTLAALRARLEEIRRQLDEVEARRQRVAAASPDYESLARDRDALKALADRLAKEAAMRRAQLEMTTRVVERQTSSEGVRLTGGARVRQWRLLAGAGVSSLFALSVGFFAALLRPGVSSVSGLARRTGLPVLGAVGEQRS
jgi:uncharacterized protein involved in exopolysaccharide biosynthesis